MATTLNVSSNYSGKEAGQIMGAAWKSGDTLSHDLLTIAENVNYKLNLKKIAYSDGTVDYACGDFTPGGTITLSEKVITPEKVMNPFAVCKEDFRQTWSEDGVGSSAHNPNMPSDIQEAIVTEVLASQAAKIDTDIWTGLAATAGEFNGFLAQFAADGSVIKANNGITAIGAVTTEATVEANLKIALSAVPQQLRKKDLKVVVSSDIMQHYSFYLISKGIANDGVADDKQTKFGKYTLTEVAGLPDDTIIIFEKANMVAAFGSAADFNEIKLVDEDEIGLLTGQFRGKLVYNFGVGYYNPTEIVWLLTSTA